MTRRRLLAIAALLLTPLAVVSAVGLVVEDPQDAFGVWLTLCLLWSRRDTGSYAGASRGSSPSCSPGCCSLGCWRCSWIAGSWTA